MSETVPAFRRPRTLLSAAAIAIPALLLAACSSNSSSSTAATTSAAASSGKPTVGFVVGAEADPFFVTMYEGASAAAAKDGINLVWQGSPTTYSPATQIPFINQVLAQNPKGLVVAPTDPTALQASVNQAIASNIPVINVDSHVNDLSKVSSFITGNNAQGGATAADAMAAAMGYKAGGTYEVVVGLSSATTTTNVDRLNGFKAEIAKKFPGIKIMAVGYSQSVPATANANVNGWLTAYPNLKGIFAIDGTNASGAASALQARGLVGKIALVGYDAYPGNVALLSKHVFAALVAQDPYTEGEMAINYMHDILTGDSSMVQKSVTLPNVILTPSSPASVLTKYTYVQP